MPLAAGLLSRVLALTLRFVGQSRSARRREECTVRTRQMSNHGKNAPMTYGGQSHFVMLTRAVKSLYLGRN
jgi:hypothetical protein